MDWQLIVLIGMFLTVVVIVMSLYHLAHGNERKAVELGAKIVIDAMIRDGRLSRDIEPDDDARAFNIEDDEIETEENPEFPDIILARSKQHAEQIGDAVLKETMAAMDMKEDVRK